jgi:hypothetical protein
LSTGPSVVFNLFPQPTGLRHRSQITKALLLYERSCQQLSNKGKKEIDIQSLTPSFVKATLPFLFVQCHIKQEQRKEINCDNVHIVGAV